MRACPLGDVKTWWVKDDISLLLSFLGFQMFFQVHLKVCLYLLALSWRLRLLPFPSDEIKRENSSRSVIISFHLIAFVHPTNILARPFTEPKHSITWQKKSWRTQHRTKSDWAMLWIAVNLISEKTNIMKNLPRVLSTFIRFFTLRCLVESSQPDADPLSVSLYSSMLRTYDAVDWVS